LEEQTVRRSDREIENRQEIDEILHGAEVLHLGFAVDGEPYVIPISFGYDDTCLYIHTAKAGRKIDCIGANPRICFQAERGVRLATDPEDACAWSFAFESVIGYGDVVELTHPDEKALGLNHIMRHYSERSWDFDPGVMTATRVWRISIESVTGKKSVEKAGS
jgi:nitroimidazol reductase NimA-like FMN-containing flavoprotein (pyridoxamine 5'-phosphate oxidase superfamily)